MASSSNSEVKCSYDIFLSFKGSDTRKKFTGYLYEALKQEGFKTFRDDEIERGKKIKSELEKAIWSSRMSIIVLSENFAKSRACLFEIHTIIKHRKNSDHVILPVFYEVDPGEIKEQARNLDFRGKKVTVEEVKGWSAALKEVAGMAGMVSGNQSNGYEAKFIRDIIGVLKSKQAGDYLDLDKHLLILKRQVEYLSGQENDINSYITSAEGWLWERPKEEVKVWLTHVHRLKEDVQRLEQKLDGEMNVYSRICLRKDIGEKILEVLELQEKGKGFGGLLIDEHLTGSLPVPPPKDFVKSTKARNIENIWELLMNDDVRQIGVYGMGGVGKTTIMKYIHNQLLEEKGKLVYWVTVSKTLNITKLQSDIAKVLDLSLRDDEEETRRASQLYAALSKQKSLILILDDVWEPIDLEMVGIPQPTRFNGCKLVLTTRLLDVCTRMDCKPVKVHLLTEEEAWTLFLTKAIGHDIVLAPDVESIAYQISKECARLPLAIVTIAGSLRGLKETRDWRNASYELTRSTRDECDVSKVFEQLKFSYNCLGDKVLQDCFLYCSLYPEDYDIKVNGLIQYWIAEGLISEMNSAEAEFDEGHAILRKLTSSCLLESTINFVGEECVRMHDLIRDMALRLTASSPRFMVKAGERLESIPYEDWSEDLNRISFMYSNISELPIRPPVCPQLTTLLLNRTHLLEIAECFFTNMHCLKVLDLSWNKLKLLPKSISNLVSLRAILLGECGQLMYVPSLKKLKALKEFKLTNSKIEELPEGIEELVNLRKLDLSSNRRLRTFPSWKLCRLSKLQWLRINGTSAEVSAELLRGLRQLKVVIARFPNAQEVSKYVTSQEFQGLERYNIMVGEHPFLSLHGRKEVSISSNSIALGNGVGHLVLPANLNSFCLYKFQDPISLSDIPCLKDARDLRKCYVRGCMGLESVFSSSIFLEDGQIFLGTIETLRLSYLPRFRVLFDEIDPPYNIHFNLKELYIEECDAGKNIFPVQILYYFPNLERLHVNDCKNMEDIIVRREEKSDWGHHRDDSNTITLPKLKTLNLSNLSSLKSIYDGVMVCPSLEQVRVFRCPMVRRLPLSLHIDGDQATPPPSLMVIYAQKGWWECLEFDDTLTKTILQPYVRVIFLFSHRCAKFREYGICVEAFTVNRFL